MARDTLISWCDGTVNPTSGCTGCELWVRGKGGPCYAGAIHTRFSPSKAYPGSFDEIGLHPGRMAKAARWPDLAGKPRPAKPWLDGMPRTIFVSDMSDALSKGVPFEYLRDEIILNVASGHGRRHIWMWLTKLPHRMAEFARWLEAQAIDWPENLWAGTSVTSRKTLGRVADLLEVPAAVRFVSAEPLWEAADLSRYLGFQHEDEIGIENRDQSLPREQGVPFHDPWVRGINLVIAGGQSGRDAETFDVAWARSLRDQCREANASYFVKQLGANVIDSGGGDGTFADLWPDGTQSTFFPEDGSYKVWLRDSHGGDWSEWPEDLRIRQMPAVPAAVAR